MKDPFEVSPQSREKQAKPNLWGFLFKLLLPLFLFLKLMPSERIPHFLHVLVPVMLGVAAFWWLVVKLVRRSGLAKDDLT